MAAHSGIPGQGDKYKHIYDSGIAVGTLISILWLYFGFLAGTNYMIISLIGLIVYFSATITLKRRKHFGAAAFVAWIPGAAIFLLPMLASTLMSAYRAIF